MGHKTLTQSINHNNVFVFGISSISSTNHFTQQTEQVSPLLLTDPRDTEAKRMLAIPYHIIW